MKKLLKLILIVSCCLILICPSSVFADAASGGEYNFQPAGYYVIVSAPDGYVNFRYGPGMEYGINTPIYNGVVLYIEQTADNYYDGLTWGQVQYNGEYGWISVNQTSYYEPSTTQPETQPETQTAAQEETTESESNKTTEIDYSKLPSGEWQEAFDKIAASVVKAAKNSYVSKKDGEIKEGAVLCTKEGNFYKGSLILDNSKSIKVCSVTASVSKAVTSKDLDFGMLMVYRNVGDELNEEGYYIPCEDCLTLLTEFVDPAEFYIISIRPADEDGKYEYEIHSLEELMK